MPSSVDRSGIVGVMDVTEPIEDGIVDGQPLRLSERIARATSGAGEPRVTIHDDGTTEIELEVYAISETALPRPDPHVGVAKRISRRFSGRRESPGTVRYVTRRP